VHASRVGEIGWKIKQTDEVGAHEGRMSYSDIRRSIVCSVPIIFVSEGRRQPVCHGVNGVGAALTRGGMRIKFPGTTNVPG
jgi:hypothetical protein